MPLVIGGKPESNFANPLGLLQDCHRRIEYFLGQQITALEQTDGGPLNEEQSTALRKALKYFREAAPRHTRDEEDSLFPRMRASVSEAAHAALDTIARLESDHDKADVWHEEVDRLCEQWLADGEIQGADKERLAEDLKSLKALYNHHIHLEDNFIFPAAGKALDAAAIKELGREMAGRRGLDPDAPIPVSPFHQRGKAIA
jgi:iron-sulfur cluster repair protein YtfE (RIC family)